MPVSKRASRAADALSAASVSTPSSERRLGTGLPLDTLPDDASDAEDTEDDAAEDDGLFVFSSNAEAEDAETVADLGLGLGLGLGECSCCWKVTNSYLHKQFHPR